MAEYMTLMGSEDVARAGSRMSSAADDMCRAASNFDCSVESLKRFLDDFLIKLQDIMEKNRNEPKPY